jgi:Tfp pilus assembly protein PilF
MRYLLAVLLLALSLGVCTAALGQYTSSTGPQPQVIIEMARPQSDDNGHYMALSDAISFTVMGFVASYVPLTSITVNDTNAFAYPVNYMPLGIAQGMGVTGFRVTLLLNRNSILHAVATDQNGNVADTSWLPDSADTLQRLQFWLAGSPGDPFNHLRIANAEAWQANMEQALPEYATAIALAPAFLAARQLRALAYLDYGDPRSAVADLTYIVGAAPDAFAPRLDLALAYRQLGDLSSAVNQYQAAISLQTNSAEAHLGLGQALLAQGQVQQASEQQQQAIQIDPTMSDAYVERSLTQIQEAQVGNALALVQQAIERNPRNGQALLLEAQIRYRRHEYMKAWVAVDRAARWGVQADPTFLAALNAAMPRPRDFLPGADL